MTMSSTSTTTPEGKPTRFALERAEGAVVTAGTVEDSTVVAVGMKKGELILGLELVPQEARELADRIRDAANAIDARLRGEKTN